MSKIKIMPEHLSNRIAAGEVIERPASVVKELVENSIDANATKISIRIEKAGARLIEISDNGSGMDADDALLCIEPHGTSKIYNEDDINNINTLGFRGEALPSISSISKFSIFTRRKQDIEGTKVYVEGGKLMQVEPSGCGVGTTIQVKELFFNTPVRKKFLKSSATECNHIESFIIAIAIPNWKISFELIIDGRKVFNLPAVDNVALRIRELFGKNYSENILPISYKEGNIIIDGFIGAPGFTKTSRKEQRTFVNQRAIESLTLYRGIKEGYNTISESGKFPPCVLFITIPLDEVDVNVHPAKREIRFRNDFLVSRAVASAISNAIKNNRTQYDDDIINDNSLPSYYSNGKVNLSSFIDNSIINYDVCKEEHPQLEISSDKETELPLTMLTPKTHLTDRAEKSSNLPETFSVEENFKEEIQFSNENFSKQHTFNGDWPEEVIGVFDATYIIATSFNSIILIDQHAAHERIMFEKIIEQSKGEIVQQQLLIPETLELPIIHIGVLLRGADIFSKLGFDIEHMGKNTIMINAIPAELNSSSNPSTILIDMVEELSSNADNKLPENLELFARAACKAAVKAHDKLNLIEMKNLLSELRKCKQGTLCPHGRPTMITISKNEIEKRFCRK